MKATEPRWPRWLRREGETSIVEERSGTSSTDSLTFRSGGVCGSRWTEEAPQQQLRTACGLYQVGRAGRGCAGGAPAARARSSHADTPRQKRPSVPHYVTSVDNPTYIDQRSTARVPSVMFRRGSRARTAVCSHTPARGRRAGRRLEPRQHFWRHLLGSDWCIDPVTGEAV